MILFGSAPRRHLNCSLNLAASPTRGGVVFSTMHLAMMLKGVQPDSSIRHRLHDHPQSFRIKFDYVMAAVQSGLSLIT